MLDTLEAGLSRIGDDLPGREREMVSAGAALLAAEAQENNADGATVPTGLRDLDSFTGGWRPGQMIVIAAKTSFGKSSLALGMARHAAVDQGVPTLFFSTEMSPEELARRLLVSAANVDSQRLREGRTGAKERAHLSAARKRIAKAPFYIVDAAGLTTHRFRAKAKHMARRHKIRLIVVDYLQQMTTGGREETQQVEVAKISRAMKQTARELKVPVVVLSQLSRKAERKSEPRLGDLRASGTIEEDADVVILIHREKATPNQAKVIVAKQRNGRTGSFRLAWSGSRLAFRDFSPREKGAALEHAKTDEEREDVKRYFEPTPDPTLLFP